MLQAVGVASGHLGLAVFLADEGRFCVGVGHTQIFHVKFYFPLLVSASGHTR